MEEINLVDLELLGSYYLDKKNKNIVFTRHSCDSVRELV